MGARVLIAVDVWFYLDALYSPDVFRVLLVKSELDVCLAELNLFETARGIGMKQPGARLGSERALHRGSSHLIDQGLVCVTKKTVLRHRFIPQDFFEVIQGGFRGKEDRLHGCCKIQERCQ